MAKAKQKELSIEEKLEKALVPEDEYPYEIPNNWVWTKVQYGFEVTSSKRVHKEDWTSKGIPFYRTRELAVLSDKGHVDNELFITEKMYQEFKEKLGVPSVNDLLISGVGTIGVPYIVKYDDKFYFKDGNVIWFKNKGIFNAQYVFYLYKSVFMKSQLQDFSSGTTVDTYTIVNANNTKLPLPPLAEQHRIADRIESLFAKIDSAKELAQNALDAFETRKAAILHKAFTGELTAKWRENNGVEMDSWEECCWSDVVNTIKDKFNPSLDTSNLPYIGLEHIAKGNGIIATGKAEDVKSLKTVFKSGDILYGRLRPYLNKHDIANFGGMCSTDILAFRTTYEATAKYLNYLLDTTQFINYSISNSKGINLPRVSEKEIAKYIVNIPSIPEQQEIVRILDNLFERENKAKELYDVIDKIDLMKKAILTRAFRGELGTNDPSEESAVELLKECLK